MQLDRNISNKQNADKKWRPNDTMQTETDIKTNQGIQSNITAN